MLICTIWNAPSILGQSDAIRVDYWPEKLLRANGGWRALNAERQRLQNISIEATQLPQHSTVSVDLRLVERTERVGVGESHYWK